MSALRSSASFTPTGPVPGHWDLFTSPCRKVRPADDLAWDAYHAAVAIGNGCEGVTTDSDFAKFPGLRWTNPATGHGG